MTFGKLLGGLNKQGFEKQDSTVQWYLSFQSMETCMKLSGSVPILRIQK